MYIGPVQKIEDVLVTTANVLGRTRLSWCGTATGPIFEGWFVLGKQRRSGTAGHHARTGRSGRKNIVVALRDTELTDLADLQSALDPEQVGKELRLRVLRGGQAHELALIVAEHPE